MIELIIKEGDVRLTTAFLGTRQKFAFGCLWLVWFARQHFASGWGLGFLKERQLECAAEYVKASNKRLTQIAACLLYLPFYAIVTTFLLHYPALAHMAPTVVIMGLLGLVMSTLVAIQVYYGGNNLLAKCKPTWKVISYLVYDAHDCVDHFNWQLKQGLSYIEENEKLDGWVIGRWAEVFPRCEFFCNWVGVIAELFAAGRIHGNPDSKSRLELENLFRETAMLADLLRECRFRKRQFWSPCRNLACKIFIGKPLPLHQPAIQPDVDELAQILHLKDRLLCLRK